MIGTDFDEVGGVIDCDGPIDRGCIFEVFLLLVLRFCPANRVSGEAVCRGIEGLEGIGEPRVLVGTGDADTGSSKTSLSEIFGPVLAICQGDAVLLSAVSTFICGWLVKSCMACCSCLFRSF